MSRHIDVLNEKEKEVTRRIYVSEQRYSFQIKDYKLKVTEYVIQIKKLKEELDNLESVLKNYKEAEDCWKEQIKNRKSSYTIFGSFKKVVPLFYSAPEKNIHQHILHFDRDAT